MIEDTKTMGAIHIKKYEPDELRGLRELFKEYVEPERTDIGDSYYKNHGTGQDVTYVAYKKQYPAGYLTLRKKPERRDLQDRKIPLLQDMWVFDDFQRQGIGNMLMERVEADLSADGFTKVAIVVGLMKSYGPAQKLYVKRGYVPDGSGLWQNGCPVQDNETITLNHDLILWLIKDLE